MAQKIKLIINKFAQVLCFALLMTKVVHAEDTQIKMFRCSNLISIFEKYGPDRHEELFRSHQLFFSITALTLGTQKEFTPLDLKNMNLSIQKGIERAYQKTPKVILVETALCSQWADNLREAAKAGRYNWAESYPKVVNERYVNFYERFFDSTFVGWISDK